jgi:hypothetical protein
MLLQLFCPPPPPAQPVGDVIAATAATPIDFEAKVAEQNRCLDMQRLLSGLSLTIAFCQTGAQRLVGNISLDAFRPVVPEKFGEDIFFLPAQHFPP